MFRHQKLGILNKGGSSSLPRLARIPPSQAIGCRSYIFFLKLNGRLQISSETPKGQSVICILGRMRILIEVVSDSDDD